MLQFCTNREIKNDGGIWNSNETRRTETCKYYIRKIYMHIEVFKQGLY